MMARSKGMAYALLLALSSLAAPAQERPWDAPAIPDTRGASNTFLALKKLSVSARVLFVMAHLDDEGYLDAMLPYASWVLHARTGMFNYIRGEKGHNITGTEFDDSLAVLRIGEILTANRYYGISDLYFSRFAEFRVQSVDEALRTFGRENLVRELVEGIRMFRPHVVVCLWSGTSRDGHGHHQMLGLITPEASQAAGLPDRYPDMTAKGLQPWQPEKVYLWWPPTRSPEPGRSGTLASAAASPERPIFRLDGERFYPLLGRSLAELALDGFRNHITQGKGIYPNTFPGNDSYALQLVHSSGLERARAPRFEQSLFEGINPGLTAVLNAAPKSRARLGFASAELARIQKEINAAQDAFTVDAPERAAPHVARGLAAIQALRKKLEGIAFDALEKYNVRFLLNEKEKDFTAALAATLGLDYELLGEFENMVPGEPFKVTFSLRNGSSTPVDISKADLRIPQDWGLAKAPQCPPQAGPWRKVEAEAQIVPAQDAPYTQPYWRRKVRWKVEADREEWIHLPYTPPEVVGALHLRAYAVPFTLQAPLRYRKLDHTDGEFPVNVQVAPGLSLTTEPEWTPLVAGDPRPQERHVKVQLVNNSPRARQVRVRLELPPGWSGQPPEAVVGVQQRASHYSTADRSAEGEVNFRIVAPPGLEARTYPVRATAESEGKTWATGYTVLRHRASTQRHLYRDAVVEARAFDLKLPRSIRVGYVSASLDVRTENPPLNERFRRLWGELGVEVIFLKGSDLYYQDLSQFDCIVIGYYTYDRSPATVANNARLLQFVAKGGLLIVASQNPTQWNSKPEGLGPYPARLFTVRVPYDATVELSRTGHPVLTTPNVITATDFKEWDEDLMYVGMEVQTSDPKYANLVTAIRADGSRVEGGLTVARYGQGYWVFAGIYAVRQCTMVSLPGPFRLMANIFALAGPGAHR